MGYDVSITADLTDAEQLAKDAARIKFDAAVATRDSMKMPWEERGTNPQYKAAAAEVDAAYDELHRADVNYFRLNIWGMGRCRDLMEERGMIYYATGPTDWPEYNEPERDPEGEDDRAFYARCEVYEEEYAKLTEPIRSAHPGGGDTIPSHKFGSNDGWHVTAEECQAALAAEAAAALPAPTYEDEETHEVKPVQWWPDWLVFLARGAEHDGFRVY
jgi:hypothetical protein